LLPLFSFQRSKHRLRDLRPTKLSAQTGSPEAKPLLFYLSIACQEVFLSLCRFSLSSRRQTKSFPNSSGIIHYMARAIRCQADFFLDRALKNMGGASYCSARKTSLIYPHPDPLSRSFFQKIDIAPQCRFNPRRKISNANARVCLR